MFIDIGVNLTSKQFEKDTDEVINRAIEHNVLQMIVTGTSVAESEKACQLTESRSGELFSTAGIHPHHAKEFNSDSLMVLRRLLQKDAVVAVGECGLDYFRNFSAPAEQRKCFEAQLNLAAETSMPVFLHQREGHKDFVTILEKYLDDIPAAVAHCFTGDATELDAYLEMGLYIGITGWVCDERRGKELKAIVNKIPLDRLMVETDAPYLLPRDLDPKPLSKRNEPYFLPHIAGVIASCYSIDVAAISKHTVENTRRFFSLC